MSGHKACEPVRRNAPNGRYRYCSRPAAFGRLRPFLDGRYTGNTAYSDGLVVFTLATEAV